MSPPIVFQPEVNPRRRLLQLLFIAAAAFAFVEVVVLDDAVDRGVFAVLFPLFVLAGALLWILHGRAWPQARDADLPELLQVMTERRRIRRRDGARRWTLLRDLADAEIWIERYHSPTWLDYVRQTSMPASGADKPVVDPPHHS